MSVEGVIQWEQIRCDVLCDGHAYDITGKRERNESMKTYPFNKESAEGRRVYKLLDVGFNEASFDAPKDSRFDRYEVPVVTQCEATGVQILMPSGLTGIKRPHIRVEGFVQESWGDFADNVSSIKFDEDERLPIVYAHPIEDETMKMMIDAGFYSDPNFEPLLGKLVAGEMFDADCDMIVSHINVKDKEIDEVPVVFIEPVTVFHEGVDVSENTTIQSMLRRASMVAIELRAEGVQTNDLLTPVASEEEVFAPVEFEDGLAKREQERLEREANERAFVVNSPLLGQDIDVSSEITGVYGLHRTAEDVRIEELKRQRTVQEQEDDEIEL